MDAAPKPPLILPLELLSKPQNHRGGLEDGPGQGVATPGCSWGPEAAGVCVLIWRGEQLEPRSGAECGCQAPHFCQPCCPAHSTGPRAWGEGRLSGAKCNSPQARGEKKSRALVRSPCLLEVVLTPPHPPSWPSNHAPLCHPTSRAGAAWGHRGGFRRWQESHHWSQFPSSSCSGCPRTRMQGARPTQDPHPRNWTPKAA